MKSLFKMPFLIVALAFCAPAVAQQALYLDNSQPLYDNYQSMAVGPGVDKFSDQTSFGMPLSGMWDYSGLNVIVLRTSFRLDSISLDIKGIAENRPDRGLAPFPYQQTILGEYGQLEAKAWMSISIGTLTGTEFVATKNIANIYADASRIYVATTYSNNDFYPTLVGGNVDFGANAMIDVNYSFSSNQALLISFNSFSTGYDGQLSGTATFGINGKFGPVPTAVPEPDEWAAMLIGLGLLGCVARRRKVGA